MLRILNQPLTACIFAILAARSANADTITNYALDMSGQVKIFEVDEDGDGTHDKTWTIAEPNEALTNRLIRIHQLGTDISVCETTAPTGDCILTNGDLIKVN